MQRFLARIENHQRDRTIIFKVIHIEYILINKSMCFNFQNMAVLCDNNAEQSKFRFSRSPCGDARYLVIPCIDFRVLSRQRLKKQYLIMITELGWLVKKG